MVIHGCNEPDPGAPALTAVLEVRYTADRLVVFDLKMAADMLYLAVCCTEIIIEKG